MDAEKLRKLEARLYGGHQLLGRENRQGAVRELARDGSREAVRLLSEAVVRSPDPAIRDAALRHLGEIRDPACVYELCAVWAATRNNELEQLLARHDWVARTPTEILIHAGLASNRIEELRHAGPEAVPVLLSAGADATTEIASRAREVLSRLANDSAREELCLIAVDDGNALAQEIALAAGWAPKDDRRRALFFFLTGQWEKYEALDFEHSLLKSAYAVAGEALKHRTLAAARLAGRADWVTDVVAGGPRSVEPGSMTEEEWEAALAILEGGRRWPELWRLAKRGPPRWSARIVARLKQVAWSPAPGDELRQYNELIPHLPVHAAYVPDLCRLVGCRRALDTGTGLASPRVGDQKNDGLAGAHPASLGRLPDSGLAGAVSALAISPDGRFLVCGAAFESVQLWNLAGCVRMRSPAWDSSSEGEWRTRAARSLSIAPDGELLVIVAGDGSVHLRRLPAGEQFKVLEGYTGGVLSLAISRDGSILATASSDGKVRLWSMPELGLLKILEDDARPGSVQPREGASGAPSQEQYSLAYSDGAANPAQAVALAPDGRFLAAGYRDGNIRLWRVPGGEAGLSLAAHTGGVTDLAFSSDAKTLASGGEDRAVRLWSLPGGEQLKTLTGHKGAVSALAIGPDRRLLASAGREETVRLWHLPDGAATRDLNGHASSVCSLAISADGRVLASGGQDGMVRLWDLRPALILDLPGCAMRSEDLVWAEETRAREKLSSSEWKWLEFIAAMVRMHMEYDIRIESGPKHIAVGEFDITFTDGTAGKHG